MSAERTCFGLIRRLPFVAITLSLLTLSFLCAPARASALSVTDIDVRLGLMWIGNAYTVDSSGNAVQFSAVSPLTGTVGIDLGIPLSSSLTFRPGLDLFGIQYYETPGGKVVPTSIEAPNALLMIDALVSLPVVYTWNLGNSWSLSAGASPSLLFRIPFIPYGDPDVGAITAYMYKSLRFFYPEIQGSLLYDFQKRFQFGITLRGLAPIFHLWDGEGVAFWDQLMVSGILFLRFSL